MTKNYLEQDFEEHISEHLLDAGYIKKYSPDYHKDLCLIPDELILFIKTSQPDEYQNLEKQYGPDTPHKLCQRIEKTIRQKGTLHVLRNI
jgi:type I restriction enzyme R subunit